MNYDSDTVRINLSSKILGLDYPKGICIDTIEQVVTNINKSGIVLLPDFIKYSTLKSVDVKNDLKLSSPKNYIQSLNNLIAPNFTKAKYPSGITFNENIQRTPLRLTGYLKGYEMLKHKSFYKHYPTLLGVFDDVLRIETRLSKMATIRKYLKSTNLVDVLNFKNLNYNTLTKIIDNQTKIQSILNTTNMTNPQEKNFAHIFYLNDIYNGDFESIMRHIKSKLSKNTKATHQRKVVKYNLALINNSKNQDTMQNIKEMQEALLDG
ncbi:hypothetical protein [Aureibaculum luteum]|uniref:hypothetical protein n=1 Tax=Aureibaculum luteum TaxID=1548456 RepID=UPI001300A77C|nr:hypothetical protein [Aureibaculum luteum]